MKKTVAIKGSKLPKSTRKKLQALVRNGFYFIKGYKIDDVPLQFTHFYRDYLRFKIIAWSTEEKEVEDSVLSALLGKKKSPEQLIRDSRVKMKHAPLVRVHRKQTRPEREEAFKKNRLIRSDSKGYVNLRYSTLEKAPYITFESIAEEDLPMFIGDAKKWTHFKDILGIISNK